MSQETQIGNLGGGISDEDSKLVDSILNDINSSSGQRAEPAVQGQPSPEQIKMMQQQQQQQMAQRQHQMAQQQAMAQQQMSHQKMNMILLRNISNLHALSLSRIACFFILKWVWHQL